jgi:hypothetical protein
MLTAKVKIDYLLSSTKNGGKEYVVTGCPAIDGAYLMWNTVKELANFHRVRIEWDDVFLYQPLDFRGRYYTPAGWRE